MSAVRGLLVKPATSTTVTFINRTSGTVELFWLDTEGKRQSYGRLRPGGEYEQHTYAGHVWLVVDNAGKPLGLKVATENDSTVEIRPPDEKAKRLEPKTIDDAVNTFPAAGNRNRRRRESGARPQVQSPDGRWEAFIRDDNVWIRGAGSEEFALSHGGTAEDGYDGQLFWSPDSRRLVAVRTKRCEERKVYFIESSPRDQLQPKLHSHVYVKPGDPLPVPRPQLFDVIARKPIAVDHRLFDTPWSIEDYRWAADSSRFTFVYNQRGHQALRLLAIDARTRRRQADRRRAQPDIHRLLGQVLPQLSRRLGRVDLDVGARRLEPPVSLRRQDRAGEEPGHQGPVGRPRRRSRGRGQAAGLVPRRRHPSRPGSLLPPLLPCQLRRHRG